MKGFLIMASVVLCVIAIGIGLLAGCPQPPRPPVPWTKLLLTWLPRRATRSPTSVTWFRSNLYQAYTLTAPGRTAADYRVPVYFLVINGWFTNRVQIPGSGCDSLGCASNPPLIEGPTLVEVLRQSDWSVLAGEDTWDPPSYDRTMLGKPTTNSLLGMKPMTSAQFEKAFGGGHS